MAIKNDIPEIKSDMKSMVKKLSYYFLQGLLLLAPVSVILFVIYKVFVLIDGLLPFNIPGLGFIVIIIGTVIAGYLGNTILIRPFYKYLNKIVDRVPLIKTLFTSITELLSAFVGSKKKFNVPVMVKMNKDLDIYKMGFLTKEDLTEMGIRKGLVAVYLPHSYNFSGNMFLVPAENVTLLNFPASETMKFIVSGGVVDIDTIKEKNDDVKMDVKKD